MGHGERRERSDLTGQGREGDRVKGRNAHFVEAGGDVEALVEAHHRSDPARGC